MIKSITKNSELSTYVDLLGQIKTRIRQGQTRAMMSANAEMIQMYWEIGQMIYARQKKESWGSGVLPRLAKDLQNELSEVRGFSARNLKFMAQFYKEYQYVRLIGKQAVSQLDGASEASIGQQPIGQIPWGHNIVLMQRIKDHKIRFWYMHQILEQGWGRETLIAMIKRNVHKRQGKITSNFKACLPATQSELAQQALKDSYLFDFMTMAEPFNERELEMNLIKHLEKFLIELGQGFAFVGRQYLVTLGENDYYIDLLFYHLKLRAYVVIELKKGPFKPEYAGKINFYCSMIDDKLKTEADNPTIGLVLCQDRDRILAEYALRDINKPIGVSGYELTQALPSRFQSSLPTIKQIEEELLASR